MVEKISGIDSKVKPFVIEKCKLDSMNSLEGSMTLRKKEVGIVTELTVVLRRAPVYFLSSLTYWYDIVASIFKSLGMIWF